ncbi:CsgG/HfaB family protein [bacterium]|nr:CsgG/HfaB family protein [bacterium]
MQIRRIILLVVLAVGIMVTGCAYKVEYKLPPHIKKIAIPIFGNDTYEYGAENSLTDAVIESFLTDGRLKIVSLKDADAVLQGSVNGYGKDVLSYDDYDVAEEYRVYIEADISLKDLTTGEILFKEEGMRGDTTIWHTDEALQPKETEAKGKTMAIDNLAKDIVNRVMRGFPTAKWKRGIIPEEKEK